MDPSRLSLGDHQVQLGALVFHYIIAGSPTGKIVIIQPPGWGTGISLYSDPFIPSPLGTNFKLVFLAPRGTPPTTRPVGGGDDEMTSRMMAHDLDLFRQHLGLSQIDLLGHSSGGTIALAYAMLFPTRVARLAVVDSGLLGLPPPSVRRDFFRARASTFSEMKPDSDESFKRFLVHEMPHYFASRKEELAAFAVARWKDLPSLWAFEAYYSADQKEGWDQVAELARIKAQTLVIVGRQDLGCPVEISEAITKGVEGAKLRVIEDCGHFPWIEKPEEFFGEVVDFFDD